MPGIRTFGYSDQFLSVEKGGNVLLDREKGELSRTRVLGTYVVQVFIPTKAF